MSKEDNVFGLDKIITKISQIEVPDLSNEHLSDKGEKVQKPDYKSEEKNTFTLLQLRCCMYWLYVHMQLL